MFFSLYLNTTRIYSSIYYEEALILKLGNKNFLVLWFQKYFLHLFLKECYGIFRNLVAKTYRLDVRELGNSFCS